MYCITTLISILQRQQTPIHVAIENGFQESVEVLLAGGADLNCREKVYRIVFVNIDIVRMHIVFAIIRTSTSHEIFEYVPLVTILTQEIDSTI